MTKEPIMIDATKCIYNTFDGGGSQRTICTLDNNFCDCLRDTDCYFKQLKRKEQECEELKRANLHIENNREHKANKLNRIEKLILACTTGYTDEFVQELLVILHEPEPSSFENKYKQALQEIKEIAEQMNNECFYDDFDCKDCDMKKGCTHFNKNQILQKISEVLDE